MDASAPVLAFVRSTQSERVLCVFNMSREPTQFGGELVPGAAEMVLRCGQAARADGRLFLAPLSAWFARL